MILFSCGPSLCEESVLNKQSLEMTHHRCEDFIELYNSIIIQLKQVCDTTDGEALILNGSGSSGMEASILNFLKSGDALLVIDSGRFSKRFRLIAKRMNFTVYDYDILKNGINEKELESIYINHPHIKAIAFTYSDTNNGYKVDPNRIGNFAKKHHLISIMDGIGGVLMNPFSMKESHIDVCIMASQKGFWMSPGLCPIVLSKKAILSLNKNTPSYVFHFYDILRKQKENGLMQYTPAVSLYYALHQALCKINSFPISYWNHYYDLQHQRICQIIQDVNGCLQLMPSYSKSVIIFKVNQEADLLQKRLEQEYQIRIELGIEDVSNQILRIGNMSLYTDEQLTLLHQALCTCIK